VARHVVVGTAGHIDHGKTTLVRALTGVDTDRLAEEKARGITIDLGFAPLELGGDLSASVVDVPGHEAFVRNMVAGATGVDVALLVVAVDEGVMPQTSEHLAILRFLGVAQGVVALTKCDAAPDPAWRELVAEDARAAVREAIGAAWPVVEVSGVTGAGVDALRAALREAAEGTGARPADDRFRMPVDRVFALAGAGTIVTGTVWSGSVGEGDRVRLLPRDVELRVRSVQVHGHAAARAQPARRAAIALVGAAREDAARGAVLVAGDGWRLSAVCEVVLTPLGTALLRARQRVHLHHGTAVVAARLTRVTATGSGAVAARLVLEEPLVLRSGDRVVLRSWSPVTTIAGGEVTEPWAADGPRRGRGGAVGGLPADDAARVVRLVSRRGPLGMDLGALAVAAGFGAARLEAALADAGGVLRRADAWVVGAGEVGAVAERLTAALGRWHKEQPLEPGMPVQAWRASAAGPQPLVALAEADLLQRGSVVRAGALIRLPGFDPNAAAGALADQERVLAALREAGAEPPTVAELEARFPGVKVGAVVRMLARAGRIFLVGERYYEAESLAAERGRLVGILAELGEGTPAAIRERLGRSRKWLIPLLEWADREGITVRNGDSRRLKVQAGT
jgi:selenocysteine-specific elongation factor